MDYTRHIDHISSLAKGSVFARFLHNPAKYAKAIGYWRLVYPIKKKGWIANAPTFFGAPMELVLPSATEIYLFGAKTHDSELRFTRFLIRNLRPSVAFCDIGAHFGFFSLLASKLVGRQGMVYAFEASSATFGILQKNTAAFPNIQAMHRAVTNEDKVLVFNEFPVLFSEYNSLLDPDAATESWAKHNPPQRVAVQGLRLDSFFGIGEGEQKTLLPHIVKIDVEGAELQVVEGMSGLLKVASPIIVIEYLTRSGQVESHRKAVDFLQSAGYQLNRINSVGEISPCADIEGAMRSEGLDSDNVVLVKK